ncbi:AMP-binding protein [Aquimonas voraii]|uniref:Acyl-coenzyme A synthetase/AMP-(Fatty) acid ligase n=1 Tax=Aquimonas voraii TaxID=265719 RepID=A0A1G6ZC53_9GAMM|nr:AMP-binding protein [Aquimonas voraii]SDE00111.1 Acyl-coenzyme A synthetase/AMP-(fatty) acid ligase [Aquimonas voraii]
MSAVPSDPSLANALLPLACGPLDRRFAVGDAAPVSLERFLRQARALAEGLPAGSHCLNLCEDRYRFILTLTAALLRGQPTLLPPSRAPSVILEMLERYPEAHCIGDDGLNGCALERRPPRYTDLPAQLHEWPGPIELPQLPAESLAVIGFTSGSSGPPKAQPKRWGSFGRSTALNAALLRQVAGAEAQILATVPAQHMYGMETSVLLPLLGGFPIHPARPFFPADIVRALNELETPRVLVTTPVHLRALIESGLSLPPIAAIVSATAPLPVDLAAAAEAASGGRVLEFYGSTETCVIAHRQTAREDAWTTYADVDIQPRPDGAQISADWLAAPVLLQDLIELLPQGRFRLAGRAADLLEIAGKRASLGELTRRLLAIPGVHDGVVFLPDSAGPVQRVAALVVAPDLDEAAVLAALRDVVDPVYLPRPLKRVAALPRNATGKLPRAALLEALRGP